MNNLGPPAGAPVRLRLEPDRRGNRLDGFGGLTRGITRMPLHPQMGFER